MSSTDEQSIGELSRALKLVGVPANFVDIGPLAESLRPCAAFRSIVRWLTDELRIVGNMDERISADDDTDDGDSFALELSAFLNELQCPYTAFLQGSVGKRFAGAESCTALLGYLLDELMAMRMAHVRRPVRRSAHASRHESVGSQALRSLLTDLELQHDGNEDLAQLFGRIDGRLAALIPHVDPARLGPALFAPAAPLTGDQWQLVERFYRDLRAEYDLRRDMLITRLDVTVQSFQWNERHPVQKRDAIAERYALCRRALDELARGDDRRTGVPALLAARADLTVVERTVSATTATRAHSVQRHLMGAVPDRGGRTLELSAPAPEMPSWTKRSAGDGGGRGGHYRGGSRVSQPQRQPKAPPVNAGYPAESSGYHQAQGYQQNYGGGGGHQHYGGGGNQPGGGGRGRGRGGGGRVQGGWSQAGHQPNGNDGNGGWSQGDNQNNLNTGGGRGRGAGRARGRGRGKNRNNVNY